jgi:hypothetical protein
LRKAHAIALSGARGVRGAGFALKMRPKRVNRLIIR